MHVNAGPRQAQEEGNNLKMMVSYPTVAFINIVLGFKNVQALHVPCRGQARQSKTALSSLFFAKAELDSFTFGSLYLSRK